LLRKKQRRANKSLEAVAKQTRWSKPLHHPPARLIKQFNPWQFHETYTTQPFVSGGIIRFCNTLCRGTRHCKCAGMPLSGCGNHKIRVIKERLAANRRARFEKIEFDRVNSLQLLKFNRFTHIPGITVLERKELDTIFSPLGVPDIIAGVDYICPETDVDYPRWRVLVKRRYAILREHGLTREEYRDYILEGWARYVYEGVLMNPLHIIKNKLPKS
jgi:hypothetical protein